MRYLRAGEFIIRSPLVEGPVRILRSQGPSGAAWTVEMEGNRRWVKEWGLPPRGWAGLETLREDQLIKEIFGIPGTLNDVWEWLTVTADVAPETYKTALPQSVWFGRMHADYLRWGQVEVVTGGSVVLPQRIALAPRAQPEKALTVEVLSAQLGSPDILGTTWPRR